jgi:F-type H+-transporting ATPase subunit epsilon
MITTVKPGVIEVFAEENALPSERIFVSGGFAEVTPQHCVVLADEAISVLNMDRLELEEQMKELLTRLAAAAAGDQAALRHQHLILEAKIKAVTGV